MADARTEAIEAMKAARRDARERGGVDEDDVLGAALDAIPTAALVRLVIDRGGLLPAGKTLLSADATGSVVVPVYRIAEEPTGAEMAAQAAVIARYRDGWVENHTDSEPNGTWWHPPRGEVEPMTDAERRVLYPEEADRG